MFTLPSVWLYLGVFVLAFLPETLDAQRKRDELSTFGGHFSYYRTDDSTCFIYGTFTVTSKLGQTHISAHRLRIGADQTRLSNSFGNELINGSVFADGVDIHTNYLFLNDIVHLSAEKVVYSRDSLTIQLRGHAVVQGDDLEIESNAITVFVSTWGTIHR